MGVESTYLPATSRRPVVLLLLGITKWIRRSQDSTDVTVTPGCRVPTQNYGRVESISVLCKSTSAWGIPFRFWLVKSKSLSQAFTPPSRSACNVFEMSHGDHTLGSLLNRDRLLSHSVLRLRMPLQTPYLCQEEGFASYHRPIPVV